MTGYLRCFEWVNGTNAICTIELFVDLPVDTDPTTFFLWTDAYPGHAFLQMKKTNGTQTVLRNIGFYPKDGWKTIISNGPVDAKFADNGGHEYNASFLMTVDEAAFASLIIRIQHISSVVNYDLDDYNCVNFAVDMFNSVRPNDKIVVPKVLYFGSGKSMSSPQGLFLELLRRNKLHPSSKAINIVTGQHYAPVNQGTCP